MTLGFKDKIVIIGTGKEGTEEVARKIAAMDMKPVVMDKPAPPLTKEEELKKVDPKLIEAFDKLDEREQIMLQRGYMTFKKRKGEYKLVDNNPFAKRGPKFTPKKKKRKK